MTDETPERPEPPGTGKPPATTDPTDLARALSVAKELAEWATARIRLPQEKGLIDGRPPAVRQKASPADIVTETDEEIESYVRSFLATAFPTHGIEGEEYGVKAPAAPDAPHWVIDPVDGTTNYAHGIGWCSFSLGLVAADGTPLLGLVADPWRDETFTATRGGGAHLNNAPIRAADHTTLTGHVFLTEWAAHAHWPGLDPLMALLSARHCTTRVMGSTALSLTQVAAGRATAAAIGEFHAVDGLPAYLIAVEAGAAAIPRFPRYDAPFLLTAPGVAEEMGELWRQAGL